MPTYDPTIILYDDEEPIELDKETKQDLYSYSEVGAGGFKKSKRMTEKQKLHYSGLAVNPLVEQFVDPGYELEMVHPKEMRALQYLRERFFERKDEPIRYYDLKAAMYDYGNKVGEKWSAFHILHLFRNLWRLGEIRRFIRGKAKAVRKIGRGEWWGVHYTLWPKKD